MKIGIIGLGRVFDHYVKNFLDTKFLNQNELFICDSNIKLLHKYSEKLNCKPCEKIEELIHYDRDFKLNYFGFQTLVKSYLLRVRKVVVERHQHLFMRVSLSIHGDNL